VAKAATVHLAPRPGTNVMLMNALLHEIVRNGWYDQAYVDAHAVGFDELEQQVEKYPPEVAAEVCDVPVEQIREAARLIGTAERLLSTVLQGFYQSHQATAAAVQVNNIHIVRGMLGRPGCGLLQMNGQPTAENTRECGADGDLPGFRNWNNDAHVADLARVWNIEQIEIPHYAPPTHAMQIFRYAETGSIRFLWIIGTNPAVSLPELQRIRSILAQERLFVVVQDIFPTETTQFADVVLPAATWGEKTGTFTNADRTVHLSEQAVEPPGEARPDLEIFLDYARRMDLRDKDGEPLIKWDDPESAFEAWKACSKGRPCDYSAITYERLREGAVQWPDATERLYTGGVFNTDPDYAETYGHDLRTGAANTEADARAKEPAGRAYLHAVDYEPSPEVAGDEHPLLLTTGRSVYHFHTRTKTGRAPELEAAAPEVWAELSERDAAAVGVGEGDRVRIESPRGALEAPVRLSGIREGVVFVPFHYGYWDRDADGPGDGPGRAANELTLTSWDPVSKQPLFKVGAVRVTRVA
jgi:anaerobic selenocysteine-containing dehydrogenase